ncbi:glycosyltransferase family 2 protein [Haliea sp.]
MSDAPASTPRLSIGLPVFNGENYLAAALAGLLEQEFTDFELIIADNASTDQTAEICRVFAASDSRIRYMRNAENVGAAANYNLTLELARGHYFKWAAHDDVCLPGFLQACVDCLDSHPDVVLCHTRSVGIGTRGEVKGVYAEECSFDALTPATRLWTAISRPHVCIAVFGVMRREVLLKTVRHGDWLGADRNLLAELSLHGRVVLLPAFLFQRREHPEASIHKFATEAERLLWFNPGHATRRAFPTWRRFQEYTRAVHRSPLGVIERLRCYLQLLRWPYARHHTGPRNAGLLWRELMGGRPEVNPGA